MVEFDVYPFLKISNNPPVLTQFLNECVDDLVGRNTLNYNNCNCDVEWTEADFVKAKKGIQSFYKNCIINETSELHIKELNPDAVKIIQDCFTVRKNDIVQRLLTDNIIKMGHNLAENIDWRLKWIMGSSKLATIREPLLQVDLHCSKLGTDEDKTVRNTVNFEVNLEQLDSLIKQLSDVKKEIENL